jgi:hypothetical protein
MNTASLERARSIRPYKFAIGFLAANHSTFHLFTEKSDVFAFFSPVAATSVPTTPLLVLPGINLLVLI